MTLNTRKMSLLQLLATSVNFRGAAAHCVVGVACLYVLCIVYLVY